VSDRSDRIRQLVSERRRREFRAATADKLSALTGAEFGEDVFLEPEAAAASQAALLERIKGVPSLARWAEDGEADAAYACLWEIGSALGREPFLLFLHAGSAAEAVELPADVILAQPRRTAELGGGDIMMCSASLDEGLVLSRDYHSFEGWRLELFAWGRVQELHRRC